MSLPLLVDSHCHLDFPDFNGEVGDVVARAHAAGVGLMVTISTKVSEWDRVRAVAERFPHVFCTVGIHPHEADSEPETHAATLIEMARHPKVVGIGETGLDYYYEHAPRKAQKRAFLAHIAASRETGLPLVIHTREADDDTADILRTEMAKGTFPALLHCFTSSQQLADIALDLGLYISLSGIVTFNSAKALQETARSIPLDRLLVETDTPFLAPVPHRGKPNEPAFVVDVVERLATVRGCLPEHLAGCTWRNACRLFGLPESAGGAVE